MQSSEKGQALFEDLRKLSFDTTFGVDELASASAQLLNSGMAVNDLNKSLIMLGDAAQGNKQKFAELSSIFAKVQLQGRAGAEQIAMFNIRGVPLTKTLKEMGVTGVASATDITKALEKLTEEGGQFHNAMNNIIDTIEGKQGFIDDTQKEILVNFGEMTGLTAGYKLALDVLYEVFDKINNALMWINENPLVKAIVAGVVTTAIVGLTQVILTALIPALIALIAKLKIIAALKSAINPVSVAIGAIVGGVVALVSSLEDSADSAGELKNAVSETVSVIDSEIEKQMSVTEELREQVRLKRLLLGTAEAGADESENNSSDRQKLLDRIKSYESEINKLERNIKIKDDYFSNLDIVNNAKDSVKNADLYENYGYIYRRNPDGSGNDVIASPSEQAYFEAKKWLSDMNNHFSQVEEDRYNSLKAMLPLYKEVLDADVEYSKNINELYEKSPLFNLYEQLDSVTANLNRLKDMEGLKTYKTDEKGNIVTDEKGNPEVVLKIDIDENYKKIIASAKKYAQKQFDDIKIKLKKEQMADFQTALANAFNFSDEDILKGFADKGTTAVSKFIEDTDKKFEAMTSFADVLGIEELDVAKDKVDYIASAIQALANTGLWKADEKTIQDLKKYLDEANAKVNSKANNNTESKHINLLEQMNTAYLDLLGNTTSFSEMLPAVGMGFASSVAASSQDLQDFVAGFQNGGIWGGIIATVVGALTRVCQGIEGFEDALNPVTYLFEKLSVLIEFLMSIISSVVQLIGALAKIINTLLKVLKPILTLITSIVEGIVNVVSNIADAFSYAMQKIFFWVDSGDALAEAQEEEAERLRRLNDQYAALYDAMREQEAYYLEKKFQINAGTYKEGVTKVNDMILTPKGTFSTSPEDTILAMKHPEDLMSARGQISVTINDYAGNKVEASSDENGNLVINISRKIAEDYANGSNGWDSAFNRRNASMSGMAYSI